MKRAIKISLKFATRKKLARLTHLTKRLKKLTNRYIDYIWKNGGKLDAATLNIISCDHLSYRQRSDCLKYALDIISSTKLSARARDKIPGKPKLKNGFRFSSLTATVESGKGLFDFVLKVSSVTPGKRIVLPFKSHKRLNHWLNKPMAKLLNGCIIKGDTVILWIDVPDLPVRIEGNSLGIDIGLNKLLATSDSEVFGTDIKRVCNIVRRKKPGSKAKFRAQSYRTNYINHSVKQIPWTTIKLVAVENLTDLKFGKKKNRGKAFRKTIAPWTCRQVLNRISHIAQENRVHFVSVDPQYTSVTCPLCGKVAKENRQGEKFHCIVCGHTADADVIGAKNIIARTCRNSQQSMVAEL